MSGFPLLIMVALAGAQDAEPPATEEPGLMQRMDAFQRHAVQLVDVSFLIVPVNQGGTVMSMHEYRWGAPVPHPTALSKKGKLRPSARVEWVVLDGAAKPMTLEQLEPRLKTDLRCSAPESGPKKPKRAHSFNGVQLECDRESAQQMIQAHNAHLREVLGLEPEDAEAVLAKVRLRLPKPEDGPTVWPSAR